MTKEKYQELTESLLDRYMEKWHDYDITLPSFAEAQQQELNGTLILESGASNKNTLLESQCQDCSGECKSCYIKASKGESTMSLEKQIKGAFGKETNREVLDERIYWEDIEAEDTAKKKGNSLTLTEQAAIDKAFEGQE